MSKSVHQEIDGSTKLKFLLVNNKRLLFIL